MPPESSRAIASSVGNRDGGVSGADLSAELLARVDDIDEQLRAIPTAKDENALRELRRTIEALSKRDPKFEERVTARVDVVADRLDTIAKTVSTTAAAIAAKDGEIAQLHRELEAEHGRVDAAVADLRRSLDPAALPEIKRALAAFSEQKLPRGLEGRIEGLDAELRVISQRVDSVSSTVSTTAAGLAGRDGDVTALRRAHETDTARIDADLAELRRAIDPPAIAKLQAAVEVLSREVPAGQRMSEQHLGGVTMKVDELIRHLDSVATSAAATATKVSASEEGISSLRAHVDEGERRLGSLVAELKQTVAGHVARAAALEEAEGEAARTLDGRVSGVSGSVDELAARLDSLSATVMTTSERLEDRDVELAAIERRFHETTARVDSLVGDLTRALAEFPDYDSLERVLQVRLDEFVGRVSELSSHLSQVEATVAERAKEAASGSAELEYLLAESRGDVHDLAGRLDSVATSAAATATKVSASEEGISSLRAHVDEGERRLGSLVAELKQTVAGHVARAAALEEAEGEAARTLDGHVSGVSGSVDELAARLDSLSATVMTTSERLEDRNVELDTLVSGLAQRLEAVEREREVSTEASQAEERSYEVVGQRIDELAARLDRTDQDHDGTSIDVARLAAILEVERATLRTRLDSLAAAQEELRRTTTPARIGSRALEPAPVASGS